MYGSIIYASLFPKLSRQVNKDYSRFQNSNGSVSHSITSNFNKIPEHELNSPRLDLPSQHAFMSLRDALWSGNTQELDDAYKSAKAAIEYVLEQRDKNKDGLPDMEGIMCSYDNFPMFGVASFVAGQFLLALKTASIAAKELGKNDDFEKYSKLFESGRKIFGEKLWNGKYFRLCNDSNGEKGVVDEGCLSDQLISQWAAHQLALGHLYDEKKIKTALKNIIKMNFRKWQGLRNCQWPQDKFFHDIHKDIWVDQANTCWTGVELAFVALLLYENLYDEAMLIIKTLDDRYRKNGMYFDHQEFGGHYFRPMSAWSIVNALLGLGYDHENIVFSPKLTKNKFSLFFAAKESYGLYKETKNSIEINILQGSLSAKNIILKTNKTLKNINCKIDSKEFKNFSIEKRSIKISFDNLRQFKKIEILICDRSF